MNFYWIIALAQAAYIGLILFTGRIRLSGWSPIDRDVEPGRFRFFLFGMFACEAVLIGAALFGPNLNGDAAGGNAPPVPGITRKTG